MTRHFNWKAGILGSLSGGLVFGIMMAMMGMGSRWSLDWSVVNHHW